MQRICNKYANICIEYAQNMQKIYAKICKYMQFICKNMQIYAAQFVPQKYAKICKNMQSICMLYAKTCKICNHVFYMQNMQKYALPTLLMAALAAEARAGPRVQVPVPGNHGPRAGRIRRPSLPLRPGSAPLELIDSTEKDPRKAAGRFLPLTASCRP